MNKITLNINIPLGNHKSRIARRLIIAIILFSSLLTLAITALQLYADYKKDIRQINVGFNNVVNTHLETLVTSMWAFDENQIKNILKGIKNNPEMELVEVRENEEVKWAIGSLQSFKTIKRIIPLEIDYKNNKVKLGELKLVAGLDQIYKNLWDKAIFILAANALKTFFVAGFMLLIVYYVVTKHLSKIVDYLSNHDLDKPNISLVLDRKPRENTKADELDELVSAINELYDRLEHSYQHLRISEERFQLAIKGTNEGIWDWDIKSNSIYFSPRFRELLGYDEDDDFPQTFKNFESRLHTEDHAHVIECMRKHLEENEPYDVQYRLQTKGGEYKWFLARGLAVRDINGSPTRMAGSINDITDRKQTEMELNKYRDHLEELVDGRTKELETVHDELVRKERLAALGQLTATVSHELRNPMGSMRPSLYVIEKKSDKNDERVQRAIERINRNIDRCDHIIDELLDFTRITKLNRHITRFDEWLESVINEQDIPKGIRVKKSLSLKDVTLAIDTDRLRRAIINVIDNACHAMLDNNQQVGELENSHLYIKTEGNKERIKISITDTGSGITKDVLDKVFEPLFSTKGFGVGLGMPTVKQIMEQHGGGIEIDTKEGKGTSVTLWLPNSTSVNDGDEVAA